MTDIWQTLLKYISINVDTGLYLPILSRGILAHYTWQWVHLQIYGGQIKAEFTLLFYWIWFALGGID